MSPEVGFGAGQSNSDRLATLEALLLNGAPAPGQPPLQGLASQVCAGTADKITIKQGTVIITSGGVNALTLAIPVAGSLNAGGDDFKRLKIIAQTAHAHTVTTPADGINGADDTATFGAAVSNTIDLLAYNGVWYVDGTPKGVTLSEV